MKQILTLGYFKNLEARKEQEPVRFETVNRNQIGVESIGKIKERNRTLDNFKKSENSARAHHSIKTNLQSGKFFVTGSLNDKTSFDEEETQST